jgi:hypothetical protein
MGISGIGGRSAKRAFSETLTFCLECWKPHPATAFSRCKENFRECSARCLECQKIVRKRNEERMAKQRKERNIQRMVDAIVGVQQGVPSAAEIVAKLIEKFEGAEGFARDYFDDFQKFRNRDNVSPRLVLDTYFRLTGMVQAANQHNLQAARLLSDDQLENELAETLKLYTGEKDAPPAEAPEIKTA